MELEAIAAGLGAQLVPGGASDGVKIRGLAYRSKNVQPGDLFFCLRGTKSDGHCFANEAVARGAAALVVEELQSVPIPQLLVSDSRQALHRAGRSYWGDPAQSLGLIGVTGTNGKTTVSYLIASILQEGCPPGALSSTVIQRIGEQQVTACQTTPESIDLYCFMREALEEGAPWAVIEVSSHGLAMGRVDPAEFDIAVVTNVTRDHFDFHKTYEAYWEAKAKLVRGLKPERKGGRPKAAILNRDEDPVMAMAEGRRVPVLTYGLHPEADVRATGIELSLTGCEFVMHLPGAQPEPCHLQMLGEHNVSNALAAAAVGHVLGFSPATIAHALSQCQGVPGRLEKIEEGQEFHVLVDYAHNPAGLAQIVRFHPPHTGRLILLFGAEGGKDKGKRAQMGEIARQADVIFLAGDNQWAESPEEVTAQVAAGLGDRPFHLILDRREAFRAAVREARHDDLLIICGRGHERIMPLPGQVLEFDDREVIREVLRERLREERGEHLWHGGSPPAPTASSPVV